MENEIVYPGDIPPAILDGIPDVSRRDYFAAMAMQGLLASRANLYLADLAKDAVKTADFLIKELDETFTSLPPPRPDVPPFPSYVKGPDGKRNVRNPNWK